MERAIKLGPVKITFNLLIMLVFFLFYVTKMNRAFSKSDTAGGIWNYIQLFFVLLGVIFILANFKKYMLNRSFVLLFAYCVIAMIVGVFTVKFSVASIFEFSILFYPVSIFAIACHESARSDLEDGVVLLAAFYVMSLIYIVNMLFSGSFSTSTGATADVYYALGLLPIAIIQERINRLIPIATCGLAVLVSGKRTGIILYAVMIAVYYVFQIIVSKDVFHNLRSLFSLILIAVLFIMVFNMINSTFNTRLFARLDKMWSDSDSSGRYLRWRIVSNMLGNSSTLRLIFGHGATALAGRLGTHAHNDYLEVLYNFGILGIVGYIGFYISLIVDFFRMVLRKYEYALNFFMALICAIGLSMFSFYVIDPTYITSGMLCFGFLLTDFQKKHTPEASLALLGYRNGEEV